MNDCFIDGVVKEPILFDHDGSADDFLSLLLLLSMKTVDVRGICITPADCYEEDALETTGKLLTLTQRQDIPLGVGQLNGVNAFPASWRARPRVLNALPTLLKLTAKLDQICSSQELITTTLLHASEPVTVLLTGPCSNLVQALEQNPALSACIRRVVWMGGAVDVGGNVQTYNHDGSAEWNVFWDPLSASKLLAHHLPLTLIPLDVTNTVAVNMEFLKRLAACPARGFVELAGQFWATTVDTIPAYEYTYFMWDVLATSYLAIPDAFFLETLELGVVVTGPSAGRTYRQPGSGQWVELAKAVNQPAFYDYLFAQLAQVD